MKGLPFRGYHRQYQSPPVVRCTHQRPGQTLLQTALALVTRSHHSLSGDREERWYRDKDLRLLRPLGGPRISQIRPASSGQGVTRAALHACFPPMTHGVSISGQTGELAYLGFITSSDVASFPREGSCRVRIVLYSPAVLRVVLGDILPRQDSRVSPLLS